MKDDQVALAEHPCEVFLSAGRIAADRAIVLPPLASLALAAVEHADEPAAPTKG